MHYRVDVIRNITEIDVKQWNSLSTTVFTSFEWIETVEETQIIPLNSYYILIYKKDKLVAFAMVYIQTDELYSNISKILLGQYQNYSPIRFNPCLLCYSPLSLIGKGIEIASNCKEEALEILQLIETEMGIIAKQERIPYYGFLNLLEQDTSIRDALTKLNFISNQTYYNTHIDIKWKDFEGYLSIFSKKSRRAKKREMRVFKKHGIQIYTSSTLDPNKFISLIERTHKRHRSDDFKLSNSFFRCLQKKMGDKFLVFYAIKDDEMLSSSIGLRYKGTLTLFKSGQNEQLAKTTFSHFVTSIYEPIKYAITNHDKKVIFGIGGYHYKIIRGVQLEPLYLHLKSTSRIKQCCLKIILPIIEYIRLAKNKQISKQKTENTKLKMKK